MDRLAEVIKLLFLHDLFLRQGHRQDFIRLWIAAWLALPHKSLYIE